jgi:CHAD domain-containing protein
MSKSEHREVERKYEIDPSGVLPDFTGVDGIATAGPEVTHELEAVYFDTQALDLLQHGVTLRRRTGGDDAGWHLKLPEGEETRTEVRMPLDEGVDSPPGPLVDHVRAIVRDRPLGPVARIATRRGERTLFDREGGGVAQVSDDHVTAVRLYRIDDQPREAGGAENAEAAEQDEAAEQAEAAESASASQQWREVEVELVDGPPELLDRFDSVLTDAGCRRATVRSKLARALGETAYESARRAAYPALAAAEDSGGGRRAVAKGTVANLLVRHLAEHIGELQDHDRGVREGEAGSVHKMRIAARRLRSLLVTYRTVFEPDSVETLREELRWVGQSLGRARDAHVLRAHLDELLAAEPPELVLGPVAARIDGTLASEHQAGLEEGLAALSSERYYRLLDTLDTLLATPQWSDQADDRADRRVPKLLRRDAKRLERAVDAIGRRDGEEQSQLDRDAALHEARKKAKRYRYAAESAIPAFGRRARDLAGRAKDVQSSLGEHQDSVVARAALREYAVEAHRSGENGFTYGRLHAFEQRRARRAEADFEQAWDRLPHSGLRRVLKR